MTPWLWRRVLARDSGGLSTAIILGVNAIGAALPLLGHSAAVARRIGAGVRRLVLRGGGIDHRLRALQLSAGGWPTAIAAMTIAFGIGQTLGPIAAGADHRRDGQPVLCPECLGAAMLAVGAIAAAFQKKLRKTPSS